MTAPGQVNNPSGSNNFNKFEQEPPYGEKLAEQALTRGAPLAGGAGTASVINAPRRARKQAGKPQPQAPMQTGTVPNAPQQPNPTAQVAAFWSQAAQIPGASPLVQELAAAANGRS